MRLPGHDQSFLHRGKKTPRQTSSRSENLELEKKSRKRRLPLTLISLCRVRTLSIVLGSIVVFYVYYTSILSAYSYKESDSPHIDFIVAGFPKCGTTTLLHTFNKNPDIAMTRRESCAIKDTRRDDKTVLQRFRNELVDLQQSSGLQRGIKCPTAVYSPKSIRRLATWQPHTKWVIGLRHPIWQVQSYYNYRITELYDKGVWFKRIRTLEDILNSTTPWKDMSAHSHRYELFLTQLAKTNLTAQEVYEWQQYYPEVSVEPNKFPIFVYSLEQLNDKDTDRSARFRQDLGQFLQLSHPLQTFGRENINHFTGAKAHRETVNICDAQHDTLRDKLLRDATRTAKWIEDRLLPVVTVSNRDHFVESLESWKVDPCVKDKE